ncbi:MAG: EamA family transporter [Candidatus Doudnabacteria bacterium]|nr:EamA family transporter [Candidatus Doudnabacteria bacterium]
MLAAILLSCGIVCMSVIFICQRWLFEKSPLTVKELLVCQHGISALVLTTAFVWWNEWGLHPQAQGQAQIYWLALGVETAIGVVIHYAVAKSYQLGEASLVTPIQAMTPGLITATGLILGEFPSRNGLVGIFLIMLGTYVHGREDAESLADYLRPFALLRLPRGFRFLPLADRNIALKRRSAIRWAMVFAAAGTLALLCEGLVVRNGSVTLAYFLNQSALTLLFLFFLKKEPVQEERPYTLYHPKVRLLIMLLGLAYGLHIMFIVTSFRLTHVASVGTLKRFNIVLTGLMAWWILGEDKAKFRLIPAVVITLGAILLGEDIGRMTESFYERFR